MLFASLWLVLQCYRATSVSALVCGVFTREPRFVPLHTARLVGDHRVSVAPSHILCCFIAVRLIFD